MDGLTLNNVFQDAFRKGISSILLGGNRFDGWLKCRAKFRGQSYETKLGAAKTLEWLGRIALKKVFNASCLVVWQGDNKQAQGFPTQYEFLVPWEPYYTKIVLNGDKFSTKIDVLVFRKSKVHFFW